MQKKIHVARLCDNYKFLIDSDGKKVSVKDSRVTHVLLADAASPFLIHLSKNVLEQQGFHVRINKILNTEAMKYAKKLCSGRECLSFYLFTGSVYKDILENKRPDEICIYYSIDQEGPCQVGAWDMIWQEFCQRERIRNVIFFGHQSIRNNFLGQGSTFGTKLIHALILSDILAEAYCTIQSWSLYREKALKVLNDANKDLYNAVGKNIPAIYPALKKWAKQLSGIPLITNLEDAPKIFVLGGGVMGQIGMMVAEYFFDKGIIPKIVELTEVMIHYEVEFMIRNAFRNGIINPEQQTQLSPHFSSLFKIGDCAGSAMKGVKSAVTQKIIKFLIKQLYRLEGLQDEAHDHNPYGRIEGHIIAQKRSKFLSQLINDLNPRINQKDSIWGFQSTIAEKIMARAWEKLHQIAEDSGLIFDTHIPFKDIITEGSKYITYNTFSETCIHIGRYLNTIQTGVFDGIVYVSTFNCQQSMNSQNIITLLAKQQDIPFITIDIDEPGLTPQNKRLLETISFQAKRYKNARLESGLGTVPPPIDGTHIPHP